MNPIKYSYQINLILKFSNNELISKCNLQLYKTDFCYTNVIVDFYP